MLRSDCRSLLRKLEQTGTLLVTAESLTGGLIGASLTAIPGSSRSYWGGFIVYDSRAKQAVLHVSPRTLSSCGAVSNETAREMARGAFLAASSAVAHTPLVAVAVTGYAGPRTDAGLPAGTVWIALCTGPDVQDIVSTCYHFRGNRAGIRKQTLKQAIALVRAQLDSL